MSTFVTGALPSELLDGFRSVKLCRGGLSGPTVYYAECFFELGQAPPWRENREGPAQHNAIRCGVLETLLQQPGWLFPPRRGSAARPDPLWGKMTCQGSSPLVNCAADF